MSAWSQLSGTIRFSKPNHGVSVQKLAKETFGEVSVTTQSTKYSTSTQIVFSLDGQDAWKACEAFIKKLQEKDPKVQLDLQAEIRCLL